MTRQLGIHYGFEFSIYSQDIPDHIERVLDDVEPKGVWCNLTVQGNCKTLFVYVIKYVHFADIPAYNPLMLDVSEEEHNLLWETAKRLGKDPYPSEGDVDWRWGLCRDWDCDE